MRTWIAPALLGLVLLTGTMGALQAQLEPPTAAPAVVIETPMPAPAWALAERALLRINAEGVAAFADRYFDARGYMRAPARWGVSDGPDDVMENIRNWPLAHALGGPDSILQH